MKAELIGELFESAIMELERKIVALGALQQLSAAQLEKELPGAVLSTLHTLGDVAFLLKQLNEHDPDKDGPLELDYLADATKMHGWQNARVGLLLDQFKDVKLPAVSRETSKLPAYLKVKKSLHPFKPKALLHHDAVQRQATYKRRG